MTNKLKSELSPNEYFYVIDGSKIKSISELAESLTYMSDDSYYYHVSVDKNDFASWVEQVFAESELASKIKELHNKEKVQIELLRFVIRNKINC